MAAERVAIVTAAAGGIGAAVASELAASGYRLALMSRSEAVERLARQWAASRSAARSPRRATSSAW